MIPDPIHASVELRSSRLTVRGLRREDVAAMCGYRSRPEVARYQSWETFGVGDAEKMLEAQAGVGPGVTGKWFQFAIVVSETGEMVGDCGLHCRGDDPRQFEVGVTLSPDHQRRGYAAEAMECLVGFAFERLRAHRVSAVTDAENGPAAAVFQRIGFRKEAHFVENIWFKGRWGSEFVFGMLRREWEGRK